MTADSRFRAREILELVSRTVETSPDADASTIWRRALVSRRTGDEALELLLRGGFIERRRVSAQDAYRIVKPYRASAESPRASFAATDPARARAA